MAHLITCPWEDHDIDVRTFGHCQFCGTDEPRTVWANPDSVVYSPIQACDMCGQVHPT